MASSKEAGKSSTKGTTGSGSKSKSSSSKLSGKENKKTNQIWQRLSIIVFRASPIDAPHRRHTGLYIQHLNQVGTQTRGNYLHVKGSACMFERDESSNFDPMSSDSFAGSVHVATIQATGSSDNRLRNAIRSTAVNNAEYDWNCQSYVGDALISCSNAGLISSDEVDQAIGGMVDITLEATDEG